MNTFPFVGDVQIASYFTGQNYLERDSIPDVVLVDAVAGENAHNATILALGKIVPQSHIIVLTLAWNFSFEKQGRCVLLKSADTDELMWILQKIAMENTLT